MPSKTNLFTENIQNHTKIEENESHEQLHLNGTGLISLCIWQKTTPSPLQLLIGFLVLSNRIKIWYFLYIFVPIVKKIYLKTISILLSLVFCLKMNLFRQMSLLVIGINREAQVDEVKIFQHLVEYWSADRMVEFLL